jgi:hypothetical protein
MAAVTRAGDFAACIDRADAFDPVHAGAAGIALSRLLWVRPLGLRAALHAAEHVLDAGGFGLVLIDLDDPRTSDPTVPRVTWLRLARAAARNQSAVVTIGVRRSAGVFATLCIETERRRASFTGGSGPCSLFDGIASAIHLRKNKLGPPSATGVRIFASAGA